MPDRTTQKPSHEDWLNWAQVVIDRLTTCVHVYSRPPHEDVFVSEKDRQEKNDKTVGLLHRIHALIDKTDTPTDSLTEVAYHDERVIDGLSVLMKEALDSLPELSTDMQKMLKSHWYDKCTGRLANELFRGPMGHEPEGIGSGHAEHGRLPEVIGNLLEREQIGDTRQPRKALHRHQSDVDGPHRDVEGTRRWADKNSRYLRSAGQVE